ncbi:MAG: hypothetical protein UU48_C0006G0152 [Candidatus Uhrbacteria bacterium GW2011_GWF2_41_16]|jgi:hypothetical protein|uniref:Uncharacterized protein n=2 Tax=Candidatus Uhriibacteriota TaxID=1752732 RepID=A0A0G0YCT3_9BACT|nr:MAG: hypothetical protein UU31_C0002G0010 [Candidatus Uhrbacteria bacterium GW2011_GWA2_41_10]KKR86734.1 MAG: hypothetical protein UU35_C0009G0021 [Candidatus Uhrbacteria bacterium GW2011_GWC2_41_11]KKR98112.1 MAG: hypothetical protein UU48_C0006G0152 [Candidatus Uhrbacteria bacterium GW2011_GWF2_41_16]HBP00338.1 hypothetical protein [Candidatus Uhrbacteria bacterium]
MEHFIPWILFVICFVIGYWMTPGITSDSSFRNYRVRKFMENQSHIPEREKVYPAQEPNTIEEDIYGFVILFGIGFLVWGIWDLWQFFQNLF